MALLIEKFLEPAQECDDYTQFSYNNLSEMRDFTVGSSVAEMAMRTYSMSTKGGKDNDKDDWAS